MSIKINIPQFKAWITALDSGEYKQTQYSLQNKIGYCCLGVGCTVTIPAKYVVVDMCGYLRGYMPSEQPIAPPCMAKAH